MNVYEMEGFLRGKCMPRDILVNESTAAYLVRKLNEAAALKADRDAQQKRADALAVENAALINVFGPGEAVVNFLSIALRHTEYDCIDLPDVALAFKMSLPETPATDAALAAIEARGVEKAAAKLYGSGYVFEVLMRHATELREAK